MAAYELHISSYGGLVAGAVHYRGRIQGESPRSCHGGKAFNHPDHRGKWTCEQGHELPERVEWDVEAPWTEQRYQRWAAGRFDGAGPQQYTDEAELVLDAIGRFLGTLPSRWWEEQVPPAEPGDELYLGHASLYDKPSPNGWGHCIAVKEAATTDTTTTTGATSRPGPARSE
jgi:hypothetical protein